MQPDLDHGVERGGTRKGIVGEIIGRNDVSDLMSRNEMDHCVEMIFHSQVQDERNRRISEWNLSEGGIYPW